MTGMNTQTSREKKQTRIEIKSWVKRDKHELINEHKERESRNYLTSMKALKI